MPETVSFQTGEGEHTAVITFDRPDVLNAVNDEVLSEFERVLERLESDHATRVLIPTGRGKAFVAGGDIAHMARLSPSEGERFVYRGHRVLRRLERRR